MEILNQREKFSMIKKLLLIATAAFFTLTSEVFAALPIDESELAEILINTQTAQKTDQIILVIDHSLSLWNQNPEDGTWSMDFEAYCGYGRNGMSSNRWAGDKTTPIGSFPMLYAFGLVDNPGTPMTYRKITPRSYLSAAQSTYNTWVESSSYVPGEHLIDYYQYKYAMNIGFNYDQNTGRAKEYGRGAAIFLHCKSYDRWWTSGCVSLEEPVMLDLLLKSHDGEYMIIVPNVDYISRY